jgi:DNA-binding MarR family transcriptional regulator
MNVVKASVTKSIKTLEKSEIIYREIDVNDRRNFRLFLTSKGKKCILQLEVLKNRLEKQIFQNVNSEDLKFLKNILGHLLENSNNLVK